MTDASQGTDSKRTLLLIALTVVLVIGSCQIDGDVFKAIGMLDDNHYSTAHSSVVEGERKARAYIGGLETGARAETVLEDLGTPEFTDVIPGATGELRVLRYRTHRTKQDGETTRDETTPLVFKDGALIGSGEMALKAALDAHSTSGSAQAVVASP